jgi:phosphate transport system ATP-binding protein
MAKRLDLKDVNIYYGSFKAVADVSMAIPPRSVTAFIGPSGCGKSTVLRVLNRMHEVIPGARVEGSVLLDGTDIYAPGVDPTGVRKTIGMVFQRPNPLPISIYENVLFGTRVHTERDAFSRTERDALVESALEQVFLWKDVKDRLHSKATLLTLEQQQKLCIARLLPLKPRVILMDEPCSALDAEGTQAIETLIDTLKQTYTIVVVTHNMGQAARASEECFYMLLGQVIEHGKTQDIFLRPQRKETEMYIEGRYG